MEPVFFPGALRPGDDPQAWDVREIEAEDAHIDLTHRLAEVPAGSTETDSLTRLHEGLHTRHSPGPPRGLPREVEKLFFRMLEEVRIDALGRRHGLDLSHRLDTFELDPLVPVAADPHQDVKAALAWLQLYQQRDSDVVNPVFHQLDLIAQSHPAYPHLASVARALDELPLANQSHQASWAKWLAEHYEPVLELPKPKRKMVPGETEGEGVPDDGDELLHDYAEQSIDDWVLCHHLTRVHPGQPVRLPTGARDTGSEAVRFERYCEDQAVFVRRRMGGTVLIDCSGSMGWDWNELRKALHQFPAATIAMYSGFQESDEDNPVRGKLCVVAEKGRWSDPIIREKTCGSSGNDIDAEALQWLAKQQKPRVWLSDGGVCGGPDPGTVHGRCKAIGKAGNIVRIRHLPDVIAYLGRGGHGKNAHSATSGSFC
jgi:hypothetical protein